jgi:hypothetical protein
LARLCSFVPIPKSKPFHTNVSTLQELYQSALNAYPLFKKIVQTVADSTNAQLEMGPIKSLLRVKEKADDDYDGEISRVVDIVRASISFHQWRS